MSWLAARRQARLERDTEQRLRRLVSNAIQVSGDFYIPGRWVSVLGRVRVDTILAEFHLPPARPESSLEGQPNGGAAAWNGPPPDTEGVSFDA